MDHPKKPLNPNHKLNITLALEKYFGNKLDGIDKIPDQTLFKIYYGTMNLILCGQPQTHKIESDRIKFW